MLQRILTRSLHISLFAALVVFVAGCGDDVAPTLTPRPPSGPIDTGRPPESPENAAMPDGSAATFAISNWRLGFTDARGVKNSKAWKSIGYNLDGVVTTRTSAGVVIGDHVCTHVDGGTFNEVEDGNAGRDNGFGSGVLPVILAVNPDAETKTNDLIRRGKHTLLVDIVGLGDAPTYLGLQTRIYAGRDFSNAQGMLTNPALDGTDVWPVGGESIVEGSLEKPLASAQDGYLADVGDGGTFVAQLAGNIVVMVDALGLPEDAGLLPLRIYDPLISMRLSADRSVVESGTVAGFISTAEIDLEAARLMTLIVDGNCASPTALAIRQQIRRISDTLRGGLVDANKSCDSISIGIEFEATRAKRGSIVAPLVPQKNPCAAP